MDFARVVHFVRFNTGTHFLDSGGTAGRHWQQPPPPESQPLVYAEPAKPEYGTTISTAAWLRDFINEDTELTELWESSSEFADDSVTYFESAVDFLERLGYRSVARDNTANGPNEFDQDFVYEVWQPETSTEAEWIYDGEAVVVFFIHTGCDIRGGYSAPIFSRRNESEYVFPLDTVAEYRTDDDVPDSDRWTAGYTAEPWYEVVDQLGEPVAVEMADDVPTFRFADGTTVTAYYPWQGI